MSSPPPHEPRAGSEQGTLETKTQSTLFDWHKRNRSLRLPIYLLVSIVILSLFFYLFQVTYPSPKRILPRTQEITILSPNDPTARSLLTSITDRTVALGLPLAPMQDAFDWNEIRVRLRPSFEGHRFRPGGIAEVADQTHLPELLAPGTLHRPTVKLPKLPPAPVPNSLGEVIWRLAPAGGLSGWQVREAPTLQPPHQLLLELPALEFTAAIDSHGRVRYIVPLGQGDPKLQQQVWRDSHLIRLAPPGAPDPQATDEDSAGSPDGPDNNDEFTWGTLRWQPDDF